MPRSKPKRRGKVAEDDKVKCPSEITNEVNRIDAIICKELKEPKANTDRLLTNIIILRGLINNIHVMDWDLSFVGLVESLKGCLVIELTLGERLESEKYAELTDQSFKGEIDREIAKCSKNCVDIMRVSLSILEKLALVFSEQDVANYFVCLMAKNSADSLAFLDVLRMNEYRLCYSEMDPTFEDFLELIKTLVGRCKTSLLAADTKMTTVRRLPYTSFATVIGTLMEETMYQALKIIEDSEVHAEFKETEFGKLNMASLFDLLTTVAEVAPFHRLNPSAYDMIFHFAIKQVQKKPPTISRNYLARILIAVLASDSSSNPANAQLLYSLPKIGKFQVNLLISQSFNYALYWLINSHDYMSSSQYVHRTAMVGLELKVITTFASKHYPALKRESLHCMELALNVLKVGLSLESAFREQQPQSNRSVEENGKILDKVMEPAFQAASYIQTILLCLQEGYVTEIGHQNSQDAELEVEEDVSDVEQSTPVKKDKPEDVLYRLEFVRLFVDFLDLTAELMTSNCERVAEAIVECFAGIGPMVYNLLDERYKRFCVISILGYARDSRMSIRTRSGRAVARFLEFPALVKSYDGFLLDAFDVIELNIKQRTTAANQSAYAWAMGNLSTTLVKYFPGVVPGGAGIRFMIRMYNIGVTLAESDTKSRYNGHRVLGGLLGWAPVEFMDRPEFRIMIRHSINLMGKQVGKGSDFKARWNACYGLGSVIQNKVLVEKYGGKVIHPVRETLMRGLNRSENFKEKSNCVKALCSFTKRDHYGDQEQFLRILEMFFKCLELPEIKVPCLYKLVNKFVDDVGLGILHFISLMTDNDNTVLESLVLENTEKLRSIFEKLSGDPERSWIIKKAQDNIRLQATYSPNCVAQKRLRWAFKIPSTS